MKLVSCFKLALLAFLLLKFCQPVFAIDERYAAAALEGRNGKIKSDSFSLVKDTVHFNPTLKPQQVTNSARSIVTFKIDEFYNKMLPVTFQVTALVRLEYVQEDLVGGVWQDVTRYDTITMYLSYNNQSTHTNRAIHTLKGVYQMKATFISITANAGTLNQFDSSLVLENEILVNREYDFSCTNNAVTLVKMDTAAVSQQNELYIFWPKERAADEYDVEWAYIDTFAYDNYRTTGVFDPVKIFMDNATRVSIKPEDYMIPLLYDSKGMLFFRVRAVQLKYSGQRMETNWSPVDSFEYNGHEAALNWQSTTTYAEDGKRKSVVQYFDGSLRNRQTVTKDNSTNTTVVAETMYDHQGRPAMQVLPSPTLSNIINYTPNFNPDINGNPYTKIKYDPAMDSASQYCAQGAPAMGTQSGAALYYSPSNALSSTGFHKFIPDAQGYPFTETRYTQDNTGRISMQSGVGKLFQIGRSRDSGRHETRYYYGSADPEELVALFGTEVGHASHYFKNMVRDANGQYSVSYVDMHGRTVATALAGYPESKLDTLDSNKPITITKKLLDSSNNLIHGTAIESSKSLVVTKEGSHRFVYALNADSIRINDCSDQPVCYDCLYDLEITINDEECNNSKFGGSPLVIRRSNVNLNSLDFNCNVNGSFPGIDTTISLTEGSYLITKRLVISQLGMERYRDSFLVRNTCLSIDSFIRRQREIVMEQLECNPTCAGCISNLGSWASFHANYMLERDIATADSAAYTGAALAAYNERMEACNLLCGNAGLNKSIRQQMLADVTPPYGQYANPDPDKVDPSSIFFQYPLTHKYKYQTLTGYKDEYGKDAMVPNSAGVPVPPQLLTPTEFIQSFQDSWANTLLQRHPEYCNLPKYEALAQSHVWDEKFQNTQSFHAAVDSGYLNPANFSGLPATSIYTYYSQRADLLFTSLRTDKKSGMHTALLNKAVNSLSQNVSAWSLATIMAHCTENDNSCFLDYSPTSTAFQISDSCSGELDIAWRYFREMYMEEKRKIVYDIINEGCPDVSNLKEHYLHFAKPMDQAAIDQLSDSTVGRDSLKNFFAANCAGYVQQWWDELKPCGFTSSDTAVLFPRLRQVCMEGADITHFFGSSTVKPSSTNGFRSFEEVLKDYCDSTGKPYNANCNAYLISAPKPYDKQPVYYNKPVLQKPDSCECATIAGYYEDYQNSTDTSFSAYIYRVTRTSISNGLLDTLRSACNGELNCNFFKDTVYLPPVFQCGTGSTCATCDEIDELYQQYKTEFPDALPAYEAVDSLQIAYNSLFASFMNTKLGFSYETHEYLAFMDSCNTVSRPESYCNVALQFDGTAAKKRVRIPVANNRLNLGTGNFTLEVRMKPKSNSPFDVMLSNRTYANLAASDGLLFLLQNSGTLLLQLEGCPNYITLTNSGIDPFDGNAHWFTVVRHTDSLSFYIDGVKLSHITGYCGGDPITAFNNRNVTTAGPWNIGLDSTNVGFNSPAGCNGWIDEVRIWNVARTDSAINANMNAFLQPQTGLVAYYPLNSRDTCEQVILDYSTNVDSLRNNGIRGNSTTSTHFDPLWLSASQISHYSPDPVGVLNTCSCDSVNTNDRLLCGRTEPIFPPVLFHQPTTCADSTLFSVVKGKLLYEYYRDSLIGSFSDRYLAKCLNARYLESFTVEQPVSEYHYTLYYYDQSGNLVKTVPPAGVDVSKFGHVQTWLDSVAVYRQNKQLLTPAHGLNTQYRYNTLNQVVAQQSPDGGKTEFWYDRLGRLVVSSNAKQKANATSGNANRLYSYTKYDYLGRITEVGQVRIPLHSYAMTNEISRSQSALDGWMMILTNLRGQITQTVYDLPYDGFIGITPTPLVQRNLRNRVSYTAYIDSAAPVFAFNQASFFSYDIHGNVDTLVQHYGRSDLSTHKNIMNMNANPWKKIVYRYDLISGKVNHVAYNPRNVDEFYHRYSYDAENRLTEVETSSDSIIWEKDARYEYYKHGPLARMAIGDQLVQGVDYAYTLQGWLKGVNSTNLRSAYDMGEDGKDGSVNQYTAKDAIGFNLNYFTGDYAAINTSVSPFPGHTGYFSAGSLYKPLFNGNISSMAVNIKALNAPKLYTYNYDQLNRLTGMDAWTGLDTSNNNWSGLAGSNQYRERIKYDANGNIQKYNRYTDQTWGGPMDSLTYIYYANTNRLRQVKDSAMSYYSFNPPDLQNQTSTNNYTYDEIGNLIADDKESITSIKWSVYGKIQEINRTASTYNPVTKIQYSYDAAGNRIGKTVWKSGTSNVDYTWYVRDVQGNVLKTYSSSGSNTDLSLLTLNVQEQVIYGSSRLGLTSVSYSAEDSWFDIGSRSTLRGFKQYELSNHLGNVLATVSDLKKPVASSTDPSLIAYYDAIVTNASDYYPFGMIMPGRQVFGSGYRYGFNGKENDNEAKGLTGTQQDYGMRIYDPRLGRFLSVDPLTREYPWYSPYQFAGNKPIYAVDLDGAEEMPAIDQYKYNGGWGWFDWAKAVPNAVGRAWNSTVVETWNSGVANVRSIKGGTWLQDVGRDAKAFGTGIKDQVVNEFNYHAKTPIKQQLKDAGNYFTSPQALEDGLLTFSGLLSADKGLGVNKNLLKPSKPNPTITLYRGVNESNVHYESALKGIVKPNGGKATPFEHNSYSTLNSPYSSWTTDPLVAENFALRPSGSGVVLEISVPVGKTVKSPNLKDVQLKQNSQIVSESEVLLKGKVEVKSSNIKKVSN